MGRPGQAIAVRETQLWHRPRRPESLLSILARFRNPAIAAGSRSSNTIRGSGIAPQHPPVFPSRKRSMAGPRSIWFVLRLRGWLPTVRFGVVFSLGEKFLQHGDDLPKVSEIVRTSVLAEPFAEVGFLVRADAPFLWHGPRLTADGAPVRIHDVDEMPICGRGLFLTCPARRDAQSPL